MKRQDFDGMIKKGDPTEVLSKARGCGRPCTTKLTYRALRGSPQGVSTPWAFVFDSSRQADVSTFM